MARLIEADALKKAIMAEPWKEQINSVRLTVDYINIIIDEQPTVDAVEVVHGRWNIDDYDSGDPGYYSAFIEVHCSECGYELGAESGQYGWCYGDPFPLNYCPNCGAHMDLEVKDA